MSYLDVNVLRERSQPSHWQNRTLCICMSLSLSVSLSLQFSHRGEGYKAEVHSGGKIPALPLAEQGGAESKVAEDTEDGEDDRD